MNIKTFAVAALVAAAVASPSAAATFIQTQNVSALAAGVSSSVGFDQFDGALGTLDSVTLEFSFLMPDVSATVTNTGSKARDFTVTGMGAAGLSGAGFNLSATGATVSKTFNLAKNATTTTGPFGGSGSASNTLTGDLSAFVGLGDLAFTFTRSATFQLVPNGQGTLTVNPVLSGLASLTYNYTLPPPPPPVDMGNGDGNAITTAVPEPAAWALMIMGFGSAGAMLRRRRLAPVRV
jgi:hypothetical protein